MLNPETKPTIFKIIFGFFVVVYALIAVYSTYATFHTAAKLGRTFGGLDIFLVLLPKIITIAVLLIYLRLGYAMIGRRNAKYGYKIALFFIWAVVGAPGFLFVSLVITYMLFAFAGH